MPSSGFFAAIVVSAALLTAGCGGHTPAAEAPLAPASAVSASALPDRQGELGGLTAKGLIDALNQAGFAAPNPVNATAQDCPSAGCDQSVVTDTVSIKSFPTTGKAEIYAKDRGLFQVTTLVVSFAPPMAPADQDRYRTEILKLIN
ncbi:hypothetical protein [Mycolicibacterium komossense]|uniref:Lipoprotein n=1 Tax=Mycolicibacterium komossense TaxID=1779 RepID=A0ABT3C940_9MYCO|nr:hypothetical protein [Mycolicibacterium komossense]MCV7225975.1 hypothetical protein [Mycolicibacterium komossense]